MTTPRFTKIALAGAVLSALVGVLPAQAQSADDAALAATVKSTLLQAAPFRDADVDLNVTASNGVVQLSGWVTYANDPEAAVRIAKSISGVRAVTERLHTWSSEGDVRI